MMHIHTFFVSSRIGCILLLSLYAQASSASSLSPSPVDRFVDRGTPAYKEYLVVQNKIKSLDDQIRAIGHKDPIDICAEKSLQESDYGKLLQDRGRSYFFNDGRNPFFFYEGDDLWYYRAITNPRELSSVENHPIHGPRVNRLNSGAPISSLRLKTPFIYLLSFHQIENICGFASLANAAALEVQAKERRPITFVRTRSLAENNISTVLAPLMEDLPRGEGNRIEYAGQDILARGATRLQLDGIVEYLDKRAISDLHARLKKGVTVERNDHLERKISENPNVHITYNVGESHWVDLSILTDAHGDKQMILLDSSNTPLENGNDVTILLRYIDDILERIALKKAVDEPNIQSFSIVLKNNSIPLPDLLDRLVRSYIASSDLNVKKLLQAKIEIVSKIVKMGDLPKTTQAFFVEKASQKELGWPKSFQQLVLSSKAGQPKKKSTDEIKETNYPRRLLLGVLLGVSTFAFLSWLQKRTSTKKKESPDRLVVDSQPLVELTIHTPN